MGAFPISLSRQARTILGTRSCRDRFLAPRALHKRGDRAHAGWAFHTVRLLARRGHCARTTAVGAIELNAFLAPFSEESCGIQNRFTKGGHFRGLGSRISMPTREFFLTTIVMAKIMVYIGVYNYSIRRDLSYRTTHTKVCSKTWNECRVKCGGAFSLFDNFHEKRGESLMPAIL